MSEHLPVTDRERIAASIVSTCEYACEWADDATLFALAAVLAQHASQVAQRLDQQRYQEMQESMLGSAQAPRAMRTPALRNEVHPIMMPAPGQPG